MNMLGLCLVLLMVSPLTLQDLIRRLADDQAAVWGVCGRLLKAAGTWVWGRI